MPSSFKSPLTLYVLWHPDYSDGAAFSHRLFNVFSRNVNDPFARTPGIPVYFRSTPASPGGTVPLDIPFSESDHTAVVILVDDEMVVSPEWKEYVKRLDEQAAESAGKIRLFQIAVSTRSFNFPVANTNFIRLFEVKSDESAGSGTTNRQRETSHQPVSVSGGINVNVFINGVDVQSIRADNVTAEVSLDSVADQENAPTQPTQGADESESSSTKNLVHRQAVFLTGKLAHELSRLLYHEPRVTEEGTIQSTPPVKMFISHAKADGADITAAIRNQIHRDTSLKSFFDANDIAVGYRFSEELLAALQGA
jgi:hypothetical protein